MRATAALQDGVRRMSLQRPRVLRLTQVQARKAAWLRLTLLALPLALLLTLPLLAALLVLVLLLLLLLLPQPAPCLSRVAPMLAEHPPP